MSPHFSLIIAVGRPASERTWEEVIFVVVVAVTFATIREVYRYLKDQRDRRD